MIEEKEVTRTFTVKAKPEIMDRLERFFALLHYSSGWGHSGLFGMYLDGDGSEKIKIDGINRNLHYEVDLIGGVGYHIEIACSNKYTGRFIDSKRETKWYTGPAGNLYKEGDLVKTYPSEDDTHPAKQPKYEPDQAAAPNTCERETTKQ